MTTLPTIAYLEEPEVIDHMGFWQAAPSDHLTRYIRHDAPELLEMLEAANEHAFENDCRSSLYAAIEGLQRLVTGKGEL